ncbi:MAG: hypothetical protein JO218_01450 [Burkholderiales bacterium]|nr:hypothetical protein [Burkholderiales bacterium]
MFANFVRGVVLAIALLCPVVGASEPKAPVPRSLVAAVKFVPQVNRWRRDFPFPTTTSSSQPNFYVTTSVSGSLQNLTLSATLIPKLADVGTTQNIYLVALIGNAIYANNGQGWVSVTNVQSVPAYQTGTLAGANQIPIVSNLNLTSLAGTLVVVGYGTSINDVLQNGRYQLVYRLANLATSAISIKSLSSTQPYPMTPLSITTAGVDTNSPVVVQFSDGAGFSVSAKPLRVTADGTVVVPVPLYSPPSANGAVVAGNVSVSIQQGSVVSPPMSLAIQKLPSNTDFGTSLGQISHAYLNYESMLLAARINELQALQLQSGFTGSVSTAIYSYQQRLNEVIEERNDVDRISQNSALKLAFGTFPDGSTLYFDQHTVARMDSQFGLLLAEMAPTYASSPIASTALDRVREQLQRRRPGEQLSLPTVQNVIKFISGAGNVYEGVKAVNSANEAGSTLQNGNGDLLTPLDFASSIVSSMSSIQEVGNLAANTVKSEALGALASGLSIVSNSVHAGTDLYTMIQARNSGDTTLYNAAQNAFIANAFAATEGIIQVAAGAESGGLAALLLQGIVIYANSQAESAQKILDDLQHGVPEANNGNAEAQAGNQLTNAGYPIGGFGNATGTVNVSNSAGYPFESLPGVQLTPIGYGYGDVSSVADEGGSYDLVVPLNVSGTSYGLLNLDIADPVTGDAEGSSVVNLSALQPGGTVSLPTVTGICNDTDASNPDGDDPDCD